MIDARSEENKIGGPEIIGQDRSMDFKLAEDDFGKFHALYLQMADNNASMVTKYKRREDLEKAIKSFQNELKSIDKILPRTMNAQREVEIQMRDVLKTGIVKTITQKQRKSIDGSTDDLVEQAVNFGFTPNFLEKKVKLNDIPRPLFEGLSK